MIKKDDNLVLAFKGSNEYFTRHNLIKQLAHRLTKGQLIKNLDIEVEIYEDGIFLNIIGGTKGFITNTLEIIEKPKKDCMIGYDFYTIF